MGLHSKRPRKIHSNFLTLREGGVGEKARKETHFLFYIYFMMRVYSCITSLDCQFLKRDEIERKKKGGL